MTGSGRVLIVPAAGRGSRLGSTLPKALVPVHGEPMILRLLELHAPWVETAVVVVNPSAREATRDVLARASVETIVAEQPDATGMLDAVLIGLSAAPGPPAARYWITWCDQVGTHPDTLERLAAVEPPSAVAFPTVTLEAPYIHFDRDSAGRLHRVRQRREGDDMPPRGETDMGLFSLSSRAAREWLPRFGVEAAAGAATGERNFLPFIPWLARIAPVVTCAATDPREAVGINTPEDLAFVTTYLRTR